MPTSRRGKADEPRGHHRSGMVLIDALFALLLLSAALPAAMAGASAVILSSARLESQVVTVLSRAADAARSPIYPGATPAPGGRLAGEN